jgi:hypothetical protein
VPIPTTGLEETPVNTNPAGSANVHIGHSQILRGHHQVRAVIPYKELKFIATARTTRTEEHWFLSRFVKAQVD